MGKRATAIVIRDNQVFLVRERGSSAYSLPGGGISKADRYLYTSKGWHQQGTVYVPRNVYKYSSSSAAIRELREETGLSGHDVKFLFHHRTPYNRHSVYQVKDPAGEVNLQRSELSAFLWWEGQGYVPLRHSAKAILRRFGFMERQRSKFRVFRRMRQVLGF